MPHEKLPPVEKIPLVARKSIRDEYEQRKGDLEQTLSELLTVPWTIEADFLQLFAYGESGYTRENIGNCIYSYFEGAIQRLKEWIEKYGDEGIKEINEIAFKHVLTVDVDTKDKVTYCGADVLDGVLAIVFNPRYMGTNQYGAFDRPELLRALNEAPAPAGSDAKLNLVARSGIRLEFDSEIASIQADVGKMLNRSDVKLNPNFEENFAKLQAAGASKDADVRNDWDSSLGNLSKFYFEGLKNQLQWQKFDQDDMLQEALNEAVPTGEFKLRIVDKTKRTYNEWVIEDGIFYIQCIPKYWGTNTDNAAEDIANDL